MGFLGLNPEQSEAYNLYALPGLESYRDGTKDSVDDIVSFA